MAVGDDALNQGLPILPDTGEEGRVRWGAREINRTRDFVAVLMQRLPANKEGIRAAGGFSSGYGLPSGGDQGDIYFQILN